MVGFSVPIKMRLQQIHCVSRRYEAKTAGVIKVQQIGNRHGIWLAVVRAAAPREKKKSGYLYYLVYIYTQ